MSTSLFQRLYGKIEYAPATGCWEWRGVTKQGYGRIKLDGTVFFTHRVAWEFARGPVTDGLCVLHHCDNPCCCNVAHLFLGTRADNAHDRDKKGHTSRCHQPHGEKSPVAKLTEEQVLAIRQDNRLQREIADEYGCSSAQLSRIKTRKNWGWLGDEEDNTGHRKKVI